MESKVLKLPPKPLSDAERLRIITWLEKDLAKEKKEKSQSDIASD